ncbi:hypothetical protein ABZ419_11925 [Streptomyces cinnamoneus]|uniref:hypothetical protein n=1 Tax=Streptomyces cinnamoneus TaxID=53446 RepID=UPI0033F5FA79
MSTGLPLPAEDFAPPGTAGPGAGSLFAAALRLVRSRTAGPPPMPSSKRRPTWRTGGRNVSPPGRTISGRSSPTARRRDDYVVLRLRPDRIELMDFTHQVHPAPFGLVPAVIERGAAGWRRVPAARRAGPGGGGRLSA